MSESLGGDWSFFDDFFSHRRPRNGIPRDKIAEETNARVELELVHLDIAFRQKHGHDPRFEDIELLKLAWELAQVSRAAGNALELLAKEQRRGRPDSGVARLVEHIIEALEGSDISVTCWYADADNVYHGTFPAIARWMRSLAQPVTETELTLGKLAVKELARRKKGS